MSKLLHCIVDGCDSTRAKGSDYCMWHTPDLKERKSDSAAQKFDTDKLPLELLPFESLLAVAQVLGHGKQKYGAHNWRKGMQWSRLLGAAFRHLFAWATRCDNDSDTGLSHLAHAACCILFLLSYQLTGTGADDRGNKNERYFKAENFPVPKYKKDEE